MKKPMFSKRHYEKVADTINGMGYDSSWSGMVRAFSLMFKQDNERFRMELFRLRCSGAIRGKGE